MQPPGATAERSGRFNLRMGLNRIFVVLWVLYVAWLVWYPIHDDLKERRAAHVSTIAIYQECLEAHGESCLERYNEQWQKDIELNKLGTIWIENGWNMLWVVPVTMFIPPLLVYGIALGFWRTGRWVIRG